MLSFPSSSLLVSPNNKTKVCNLIKEYHATKTSFCRPYFIRHYVHPLMFVCSYSSRNKIQERTKITDTETKITRHDVNWICGTNLVTLILFFVCVALANVLIIIIVDKKGHNNIFTFRLPSVKVFVIFDQILAFESSSNNFWSN